MWVIRLKELTNEISEAGLINVPILARIQDKFFSPEDVLKMEDVWKHQQTPHIWLWNGVTGYKWSWSDL